MQKRSALKRITVKVKIKALERNSLILNLCIHEAHFLNALRQNNPKDTRQCRVVDLEGKGTSLFKFLTPLLASPSLVRPSSSTFLTIIFVFQLFRRAVYTLYSSGGSDSLALPVPS